MEHQMLVRTFLVEVASAVAALTLVVLAVACWRRPVLTRRLVAVACVAGALAAGVVTVRSHHTLAVERARKCNSNVQRALCDQPF
jgi:hypothetical protein